MTDDSNSRHRSADPYGREPAAGGQGSDPLAELARLIGQNDPFSELGRDARPASREPSFQSSSRRDSYGDEQAAPAWAEPAQPAQRYDSYERPAEAEPHYDPRGYDAPRAYEEPKHHVVRESFSSRQAYVTPQAYAQPAAYDEPEARQAPPVLANGYAADHFADHPGDSGEFSHQHHAEYPGHAAGAAGSGDGQGYPIYPREPNAGTMPAPHEDDFYDDAPPSRRKSMLTVAAVLALAVVGSAGAFGYRTVFGHASSTSAPPVIRASTEPTKIAPPPSANGDASANKLSYDRFGDRGQNEQVVGREEKPVDMRDIVRTSAPSAAIGASSPSATGANPPSVLTEPKRVRTVPIRPNQQDAVSQQPQSVAQATTRPAVVASIPNAPLDVSPSGSSARAAAPPPARVQQQPVPNSNGPLSLNPDAAQTQASLPPPRAAAPARTASVSTGGGQYLVQVSSQRSEADAQSSYRSIKSKYASVLGEQPSVIRRADLGDKGTYYRAMVGPFGTRDQAIQLCTSLKAAGGACVVQGN